MRPRFADPRIAFITVRAPESSAESKSPDTTTAAPARPTRYIQRYRLEKLDPAAAVSDVVKPIVFYIAPDMPRHIVPWIKRGVEAWQPTFDAIGFRNAILAREAPSEAQDSALWKNLAVTYTLPSSDKVRELKKAAKAREVENPASWKDFVATHNLILWDPHYLEEGGGYVKGTKVDPQTGEVLAGKIFVKGPTEKTLSSQAFAYFGGDPKVPVVFPDSLLGPFYAAVIMHEVGHLLGLDHNFSASSTYPTDSLRSAAFVRRMGMAASVMDYAVFNSVVQPEDGIPLSERAGGVGPYDRFAIAWAYRPILGTATPEAELATLEAWREAQDTATYLSSDAGMNESYDLGADVVQSGQAILRNLARSATRLIALRRTLAATPALPEDPSGDNHRQRPDVDLNLIKRYQTLYLKLWRRALYPAIAFVGGSEPVGPPTLDPTSRSYVPVDSARQVAALRFLLDVVRGRDELIRAVSFPSGKPQHDAAVLVLDTLPEGWSIDTVQHYQSRIIERLLSDNLEQVVQQTSRTKVLPVFCTELESLRRDFSAAVAHAKAPKTLEALASIQAKLERATTSQESVCRQHGWSPTP